MSATTEEAPSTTTVNNSTALLCSTVLLDPAFCDLVFRILCVRRIRTLAPSPGVDLVVLARHAAWALDQRCRRHIVTAGGLTMALLSSPLVLLNVNLWLVLAGAMLLCSVTWAIVDQARVDQLAVRTVQAEPLADLGRDMLDASDEQRLADVNDANVAIYSDALDDNPFPGNGQRVRANASLSLDVSLPLDRGRPVDTFRSGDLLEHLSHEMPQHLAGTESNDVCDVRQVLYVRGTGVRRLPDLPSDEQGCPLSRVPRHVLRLHSERPTTDARTYLRAQIVGHGGRLVTTCHIALGMRRSGLWLDLTLHVLRPVHPVFGDAEYLPRTVSKLAWGLVRQGEHLRRLFTSTVWAWQTKRLMQQAGLEPRLAHERGRAPGTYDHYGTFAGLRAAASLGADLDYNLRIDVDHQVENLVTTAFREIGTFLEALNIDASELRQKRSDIVQDLVGACRRTISSTYDEGVTKRGLIVGDVPADAGNLPNLADIAPSA